MEGIKVKKFGPTCGKHGSSVFYKAFKYKKNGKSKIISLGQFFFMKILDSIPICIGEVQLVWEDKPSGTDLASVRLYFLPECTPDGRQTSHGEAEIIDINTKNVTQCGNRTCYHNAICSTDGESCRCRHGYDGVTCQEDVNECEVGSPCYHRGHCRNTFGSWECDCLQGWENSFDIHCENKTSPDINYRKCIPGWMGDMCQDQCLNDYMCGRNQNCRRRGRGLKCLCTTGWEGENCTIDVNECTKNPCKDRQICLNTEGSFTCACEDGWKGPNCFDDVDECVTRNPCKNSGLCINNNGSYQCLCETGWEGTNCDVDLDECASNPCNISSICMNQPGNFSCEEQTNNNEVDTGRKKLITVIAASVGSFLLLLFLAYVIYASKKKCKRKVGQNQDQVLDARVEQREEISASHVTRLGFVYPKDKPAVNVQGLDF